MTSVFIPTQTLAVDNTYYEIERIVGRRVKNGIEQYRVKWRGYSWQENTWEPKDMFNEQGLNAIDLYNASLSQVKEASLPSVTKELSTQENTEKV